MLLAGDNTNGYRSNHDMAGAGSYPVGYAIAAGRNTVQHGAIRHFLQPKGLLGIVDFEGTEKGEDGQQMAICRRYDWLYHRTRGASIVYIGEDGEQDTHSLDDFDDDNDYHVQDLSDIPGLAVGMWYYIQAEIVLEDVPPSDDTPDEDGLIVYAAERDNA